MQEKINSIDSDLKLLDKYIEELEEQKNKIKQDNLKLKMLIEKLQEESY